MGLDATVRCRCWEDGLTSAPPVARELITEDEGDLSLWVDYDGNEDLYERLRDWKRGACAHEDMKQARVRVANWTGYGLFVEALETVGWERFPTLDAYLESASATLPAASAPAALPELDVRGSWCVADGRQRLAPSPCLRPGGEVDNDLGTRRGGTSGELLPDPSRSAASQESVSQAQRVISSTQGF